MIAGSASYTTGGSGASVSPSRGRKCAPPARGRAGAFVVVVAKGVVVGALSLGVEA